MQYITLDKSIVGVLSFEQVKNSFILLVEVTVTFAGTDLNNPRTAGINPLTIGTEGSVEFGGGSGVGLCEVLAVLRVAYLEEFG